MAPTRIPDRRNPVRALLTGMVALTTVGATLACAQSPGPPSISPVVHRPPLPSGADTARAANYQARGSELLRTDAALASAHFQWAALLAPDQVGPLHGWRAALMMQTLEESVRDPAFFGEDDPMSRLSDSLYYEGILRAPLLFNRYEREVWDSFVDLLVAEIVRETGIGIADAQFALEIHLRRMDPATRGWNHFVHLRWGEALKEYDDALKGARGPDKGRIHIQRAHLLGVMGRLEEARQEMASAMRALREEEEKELRPFYESKAMYLHIIGALLELQDKLGEAEAAYGQAVSEDLSFPPAHVALARMAVLRGDTALADSEFRIAVDLRPQDPLLRFQYADLLRARGEVDQAISHLEAAVQANPWWASPYRGLGILHEGLKEYQKAHDRYAEFLSRAALDDPNREWAQARRELMASYLRGGAENVPITGRGSGAASGGLEAGNPGSGS